MPEKWDLDGDRLCDDAHRADAPAGRSGPPAATRSRCASATGPTTRPSTRRFTVQNRPPAAAISYAPLAPLSGDSITLASTSADPDGPIVAQDWDLDGDGAFDDAQGPTASVSFAAAGSHPVGLLVTDRDGAANVAAVAIAVRERPPDVDQPVPGGADRRELRGARDQDRPTRRHGAGRRAGRDPLSRRRMSLQEADPQAADRRPCGCAVSPGGSCGRAPSCRYGSRRPGEIGKYTRLRIRKGKRPTRVDRCLMPGSKQPTPCPS